MSKNVSETEDDKKENLTILFIKIFGIVEFFAIFFSFSLYVTCGFFYGDLGKLFYFVGYGLLGFLCCITMMSMLLCNDSFLCLSICGLIKASILSFIVFIFWVYLF